MNKFENRLLAEELSKELDDQNDFGYYLTLAEKYDHEFLREIANWVSDYPNPKHRGKLFTWRFKKMLEERETKSDFIDEKGLNKINNFKNRLGNQFAMDKDNGNYK